MGILTIGKKNTCRERRIEVIGVLDFGKSRYSVFYYMGDKMDHKMQYEAIYLSEFSDVFYVGEKNVVLVHWKKYCELEQYRTPLKNALKVIKNHPGCNYVADTRDGFEDNPLDTEWVAEFFMPKAKEYGCQIIYFIIDKSNSLKEELEGQEKDSSKLLEFRYIYGMDEI